MSTGPFYVAPHPDEVIRHFQLLHDAVDIPVLAYDIPSATHTTLPRVAVASLAHAGTIAGLKDSSGDITAFRQIPLLPWTTTEIDALRAILVGQGLSVTR